MKRILIYVSDHGYGHAARMVALTRKLLKTQNYQIVIKNHTAFDFLKSGLPDVRIEKVQTDVGPVFDWNSFKLDLEATYTGFTKWIENESNWLTKEAKSFKENPADLVLTDISPMALRLAEMVGCPAITVGNFSWIDILKKMPFHEKKHSVLKWLKESFSLCDFAIKLPLSMSMEGFQKTIQSSLLCRDVTIKPEHTLENLGLDSRPVVVYIGDIIPKRIKINNESNLPVIIMSGRSLNIENAQIYSYEGQNVIAAANLIITKAGYSTLAECVRSRCPMYILPRIGYPEDEVLCNQVKEKGIAEIIDLEKSEFQIDIPFQNQIDSMRDSIKEELIVEMEKFSDPASIIKKAITS